MYSVVCMCVHSLTNFNTDDEDVGRADGVGVCVCVCECNFLRRSFFDHTAVIPHSIIINISSDDVELVGGGNKK